ncbi:MAG: c-type cytochrome biogenesis protein CcmI [Candidatus Dactylopiibacterium sp.]|nr:c-type cytochrome biogenesis protein CcmI [Candidatus Dactylopiibacterium sp.]
MTGFLIAATLITLSALAYLLRALLAPRALPAEDRRPALAVLREQRRELDADLQAGRVEAAEHAETLAELERRAAAEMDALPVPAGTRPARAWALALGCALPVCAIALYLMLGQPVGLDPASAAPERGFTREEVAVMVDQLAAKVRANPADVEGARMLARSYMMLERFHEAATVYAGIAARTSADAQLYADWADAAGSAAGGRMEGEPARLVARALELDPDNVKALAIAGGMAFERHDYREAQQLWTRMSGKVDAQSEMGRSVQTMLSEVARRLEAEVSAPAGGAAAHLQVAGRVTLASALREAVAPGDALFVFVRPAAGGMPVAAQRFAADQWPLSFDFSRTPLMTGEAAAGPYVVVARISRQGNAVPASGDLEGVSQAFDATATALEVEISRRLP